MQIKSPLTYKLFCLTGSTSPSKSIVVAIKSPLTSTANPPVLTKSPETFKSPETPRLPFIIALPTTITSPK